MGGAMKVVMPGMEDPFGGPPLASSRQRAADIGGPRVSDENVDPRTGFAHPAFVGRGGALPLAERSASRTFSAPPEAARAVGRLPFSIYRDYGSSTNWETSMDVDPPQEVQVRQLRFDLTPAEAANAAGLHPVAQPLGRDAPGAAQMGRQVGSKNDCAPGIENAMPPGRPPDRQPARQPEQLPGGPAASWPIEPRAP